jgi:putative toxin-antitoxin system antitoxin component (TIGR02293 family)
MKPGKPYRGNKEPKKPSRIYGIPTSSTKQRLSGGPDVTIFGAKGRGKALDLSSKQSNLPSYAIICDFDASTGLTFLSSRSAGSNNPEAGLPGIEVVVTGPFVQMKPSALKVLRGFTDEEIYNLVVPKRTLARRTAEKQPLSVEETDRAVRLARVGKMAETIFKSAEKAHRWLRKPKPSLEGETPLNYLASETGARVVEEMLTRIDHGILP